MSEREQDSQEAPEHTRRTGGSTIPESRHTGDLVEPGMPMEISDELALAYETGVDVEARSHWAYARKRFLRHRLAMASLIVLAIILGASVFADSIAPYAYNDIDLFNTQAPPTAKNLNITDKKNHYFGTDLIGRDYFSRVLFGIRTSARVAFIVALLSTIIGTAVGAIAGYFGGWIDNLLMRLMDVMFAIPSLVLAIAITGIRSHNFINFIIEIGLV